MSLLSTQEPPPSRGTRVPLVIGGLLLTGALAGGALWLLRESEDTAGAPEPATRPATPRTGTLEITADAEGAVVHLDGQRLGLAPQTLPALAPGRYRVRVERFDRESFEAVVELQAGERRTLHATLEPESGARGRAPVSRVAALRVVADVPGASVFLDREFVGHTPVEIARLGAGSHRLNVSAEGYEMYVEEIDAGDGPREVRVRFKEVRLQQAVAVKHKRTFGSNQGTLSAAPEGLRFESENPKDSFRVGFDQLEVFEVDYLKDNLKLKIRGGRTYNFTSRSGDPDELFVFHREVEEARSRLGSGPSP